MTVRTSVSSYYLQYGIEPLGQGEGKKGLPSCFRNLGVRLECMVTLPWDTDIQLLLI